MLQRMKQALLRLAGRHFELSLEKELWLQTGSRPHYLYCVYHAAQLARRLNLSSISVLEFGVAGGNGLVFLERLALRIQRALGIEVQVYGFDTGMGLPAMTALEDLPYWFRTSQYAMDVEGLEARLRSARLVLGDVEDTVPEFFARYRPAPVGAILNDLDLYTSTVNSLRLFDHEPANFLPRVFLYFDDIIGNELSMYGPCNGQLRAISEFNARHSCIDICLNQNLLPRSEIGYRYQLYYGHLRAHPQYTQYIGGDSQTVIESHLKLKADHQRLLQFTLPKRTPLQA
jgi:hypothetical protein